MKGPAKKEEVYSKVGSRIEYETKVSKIKRTLSSCVATKTQTPTTYDEAKASCKARKRKERQESISSLCQERKVIRSNSEERPVQRKHVEKKDNIRRVASSEDFKKSASIEKINVSPSRYANEKTLVYEDYEHEKRRSHERFSRPLALRSKRNHPNKRLKMRYTSRTKHKFDTSDTVKDKDHNAKIIIPQDLHHVELELKSNDSVDSGEPNFMQLHGEDNDRSPSPVNTPISPVLDFKTLHEQIDCSEPVLSSYNQKIPEDSDNTQPSISRLLLSPRNSIIATHRIYLDKDVPQIKGTLDKKPKNLIDERMQKLAKEINTLKKKIKKREGEFEAVNGFKPSHVDKLNDSTLKRLYADLSKLKKEQKQLTDVSSNCPFIQEPKEVCIKDTLEEIEKTLSVKRETANRSLNMDQMTPEQLMDEKFAIQRALLHLESVHGRPNKREDRDLARPYYDRYRTLKRMVAKFSTQASIELATIHEDETIHFITSTPLAQSSDTESEKPKLAASSSTDSDTDVDVGANYHSLSREELVIQIKRVGEEKKELRRTIKEFEAEFQLKTGRMIQKEDKVPKESVYMSYKKVKAKLRLLEALIGKQN